jgi:hypothetical protein
MFVIGIVELGNGCKEDTCVFGRYTPDVRWVRVGRVEGIVCLGRGLIGGRKALFCLV